MKSVIVFSLPDSEENLAAKSERNRTVIHEWGHYLKECDSFFSSPLQRAREALFAIMLGMDFNASDMGKVNLNSNLWVQEHDSWAKSGKFHDRRRSEWMLGIVKHQILPKTGNTALCVLHRNLSDLLLVSGQKKLGKKTCLDCEGFILIFHEGGTLNGTLYGVQELRLSQVA